MFIDFWMIKWDAEEYSEWKDLSNLCFSLPTLRILEGALDSHI